MSKGRVLIIAGSDSGGGAGIQADIKTVTMLGGYAATAITAITAQNTQGVQKVKAVDAALVKEQALAVLEDIGADAIKTGMLHSESIIQLVVELAERFPAIPLIVDPVMVAKGGHSLLKKSAMASLRQDLLPKAALVTPNIPETEILASTLINGPDGMLNAGRRLIKQTGCQAVLVKGGHGKTDPVIDMLVTPKSSKAFENTRLNTVHTHGTGCTLASAIATYIALGYPLPKAVRLARHYVQQAIQHAPGLGKGHGPLGHGWPLGSGRTIAEPA